MKKIFAISLIAMSAVTAANAEIASKAYVDPAADGTYVKTNKSGGQNFTALDNAVKTNTDAIAAFGNAETGILKTAKDYTDAEIDALDVDSFGTDTEVIMSVSESDGKIAATKGQITNSHVASNAAITTNKIGAMTGYAEAQTGADVAATDTLNEAVGKLQKQIHEAGTASTVAAGNYTTANQSVANAIGALDTGLGAKIATDGNYIKDSEENAINANISALDTALGAKVTDGVAVVNTNSVNTNLQALDTKIAGMDYTGATGGNVITQVTETDGTVTATMGMAILETDTINANGTYVLTATRSGTEGNYTYTYQWENIERAPAGN